MVVSGLELILVELLPAVLCLEKPFSKIVNFFNTVATLLSDHVQLSNLVERDRPFVR